MRPLQRFHVWIECAPMPVDHVGAMYRLVEQPSDSGKWIRAEDAIRSCTCETKYGTTGGCVICNPGKLLELADRALAVCEAQHGAGDRCCLMREVSDALRVVAGVSR